MLKFTSILLIFMCLVSFSAAGNLELSEQKEAEHAIVKGLKFLESTQLPDGSWSYFPGITGLTLIAFLNSGFSEYDLNSYPVQKGLEFLEKCVQPDGGIYGNEPPKMEAYNTSIGLLAFVTAKDPKYDNIIRNARDYLISLQAAEDIAVSPDSSIYGGIGYNKDERSDLSNMQLALEALKASEKYRLVSEADGKPREYSGQTAEMSGKGSVDRELFWDKAIIFLQRCQNLAEYNDLFSPEDSLDIDSIAFNDGGFVYYPGYSKAGGHTSYGSMSYAGMKSYIHAGLDKNDPRVQAVKKWIAANYTVEHNPEMGTQGLYYYYFIMAKTLALVGEDTIVDTLNTEHNWRYDLTNKLISLQHDEGYWLNDNGRWWENNKDLVTSYTVTTLEWLLGRITSE